MEYKEIIQEIMSVYNINASEFAERINVQRSGISHILSGRNNPSIDFILKVKEEFPDIQWEFLMKGKKPMFITNVNKATSQKFIDNLPLTLFDEEEYEGLKHHNSIKKNKPQQIKKIVWFYGDNTFEEFYPQD